MSNQLQGKSGGGESFASRFGAIMSMAGMCIGMGSVWRFPYMVGQYGGGSFIIAYVISCLVIVLPLAIVECGIGKGYGKGMIGVFTDVFHSKAGGKVVGSIYSVGYFTMNFFYYAVLASSTYFIYSCAVGEWNTKAPQDIYPAFSDKKLLVAIISVVLVVATIWVIVKGVDAGIEKMSKIMIPMMFVFFIAVIIFGIFCIDGIQEGYNWYLQPDWEMLAKPEVWLAAVSQGLFAVGVGPGCVLTYGSHLKKTSDVTLNMTTVCLLTCSVGVIVGMALIPACIAMGLDPASGSMLIYEVIPTLLSRIPAGRIVGVLLFVAIFFAGFSTAIAQTEVAVATFANDLKWGRRKAGYFFGAINIVTVVWAAYSTRFYDFWNDFSGNYVFIITAGVGAILFMYVIGAEKVRLKYLNPSSDIRVGKWFSTYAKWVAAPLMILVMLNSLFGIYDTSGVVQQRGEVAATLSAPTIVILVIIVVLLFGSTIYVLRRCIKSTERTPEDIAAYEAANPVPEKAAKK